MIKGLEKIAQSANIPMLVTGDLNSPPGSAAYDILTKQNVNPDHKASCLHVPCNKPCLIWQQIVVEAHDLF